MNLISEERRLFISGLLLLGGMLSTFFLHGFREIEITLFLIAAAICGIPILINGGRSLRGLELNINVLMSIAIISAIGIGYYQEAAMLSVLYAVAEWLEDRAVDKTKQSLEELRDVAPEQASLIEGDETTTVPISQLQTGDTVRVKPGDKIPIDGTIVSGSTTVNEAPITGESKPQEKQVNDKVYAGTINQRGYIEVLATGSPAESTITRIIELVGEARHEKTEYEETLDKFVDYYMPTILVLAILTVAIPVGVFDLSFNTWFIRGLTFIVIACPCAFVISTPVAVVSGITSASRNGVLIKSGRYLEQVKDIDIVAFDKTGTLTEGEFTVSRVITATQSKETILHIARSAEKQSEHPIADSIVTYADQNNISEEHPEEFQALSSGGIWAKINGTKYFIGSQKFIAENTTTTPRTPSNITPNDTIVTVASKNEILGYIILSDKIRPHAKQTINALHDAGVSKVVMLTGDAKPTADAVANEIGVDAYHAELLPEDKIQKIRELRSTGTDTAVMMVGDGVNDAPALATANVSVAMGAAGTDTAIENSNIALMDDKIEKIPYLFRLSSKTNTVIRENIAVSLLAKTLLAIGIPIGYVTVAVAIIIGDMGMSLTVTGNALRLSKIQPQITSNETEADSLKN